MIRQMLLSTYPAGREWEPLNEQQIYFIKEGGCSASGGAEGGGKRWGIEWAGQAGGSRGTRHCKETQGSESAGNALSALAVCCPALPRYCNSGVA